MPPRLALPLLAWILGTALATSSVRSQTAPSGTDAAPAPDAGASRPTPGRFVRQPSTRPDPPSFQRPAVPPRTPARTASSQVSGGGRPPPVTAPSTGAPGAARDAPSAAAPSAEPSPEQPKVAGDEDDAGASSFVRRHRTAILVGLSAVLAGSLAWLAVLRRRRQGEELGELGEEDIKAPSKPGRYSSTQIRASDVKARLGERMLGTTIDTDREYALVVDEAALGGGREHDEEGRRVSEHEAAIRRLLSEGQIEGAYAEYSRSIEEDATLEMADDIERSLGERLLEAREFERSARVLEHHVATRPPESIDPRIYFRLAYAHALRGTRNKARRFLKLFAQSEKDEELVARARTVLRRLDATLGT